MGRTAPLFFFFLIITILLVANLIAAATIFSEPIPSYASTSRRHAAPPPPSPAVHSRGDASDDLGAPATAPAAPSDDDGGDGGDDDDEPAESPTEVPEAPSPVSESASPPPPPSPISSLPKVVIRGRVYCGRCRRDQQSYDIFRSSHKNKTKMAGVTVNLSCPQTSFSTKTDHHGHFKFSFRQVLPEGFPLSCTVSVATSTLPQSCSNPIDTSNSAYPPRLHSSKNKGSSYTVPVFEFTPTKCN